MVEDVFDAAKTTAGDAFFGGDEEEASGVCAVLLEFEPAVLFAPVDGGGDAVAGHGG